jgi:hypothetical protein
MSVESNSIFLSINSFNQTNVERRLLVTLERAGFSIDSTLLKKNDSTQTPIEVVENQIENSSCSIHLVDKKQLENSNSLSMSEQHFNLARKKIEKDANYKTFIWVPGNIDDSDANKKQLDFINSMQHHLSNNMILSRVSSAIQFVEDVRFVLEQEPPKIYPTKPTDVFLIHSQVDEKEVQRIQTMFSGILSFTTLSITQDSGIDYEEYASQQMSVSKITVIYYKKASDWAFPFVQQIWKKVGGASAKSPILFVGDAMSEAEFKKFSAPMVSCFNLPIELIPLEIKVQFDSLAQ